MSKISQNRDEVKRVLKAVLRAMDDFKNHKDKIRPLLIKHTKIRPEYFDFIYQKNLDVFSPDGSLGEADVRTGYLDARKGAVNAPPVEMSTVFDLGPLREVEGK